MTNMITATEFFYAAFLNPFESPNRIAVASSLDQEVRFSTIKNLDKDPHTPKYLSDFKKRIMIIVVIYLISTATIVPLIVILCLAIPAIKKVQLETDRIESLKQASDSAKLDRIRACFHPAPPAHTP